MAWAQGAVQHDRLSVLLVYDAGSHPSSGDRQAITWMRDLLGHFDADVTAIPVAQYRPRSIGNYRATVFLGLRDNTTLPPAFLADAAGTKRPLCWVGSNMQQLIDGGPHNPFGFVVAQAPDSAARKVSYNGASYWRDEAPLPAIDITDHGLCAPVATTESGNAYAVQAGRVWYFPELPLRPAREPGAHLIICDQMHEVLDEPHDIARTALLAVRNVTPETDPGKLNSLIRTLQGEGVAFAIETQPIARDAEAGGESRLEQNRRLVGILRGAQRAGATIIGVLPQTDVVEEAPSAGVLQRQFESALAELARCGLYPLAWAVDQQQLWDDQASALGALCSTIVSRQDESDRESVPAPLPFLVVRNCCNQQVMPENLPSLVRGQGEVEAILEAARRQSAVPDSWVTVTIAPGAPGPAVSLLLDGLRSDEYTFYDPRFADNRTAGRDLHIVSVSRDRKLSKLLPRRWDATLLGPAAGARRELDGSRDHRALTAIVHPGAVLFAYPSGRAPRVVLSLEGDSQQVAQRGVQRLAQLIVMFALASVGVLFLIYVMQLVQRRGA